MKLPQAGKAFLTEDGSIGAEERIQEDTTIGSYRADMEHLTTGFFVSVVSCIANG
jgi:hypothetical protein